MATSADTHVTQAPVLPVGDEVMEEIENLDLSGVLAPEPVLTVNDILADPWKVDMEELPGELRIFAQRAVRFKSLQKAEETARLLQADLSQRFNTLLITDPSAEEFETTLDTLAGNELEQNAHQYRWGISQQMLAEGRPSEIIQQAAQARLEEIARKSGLEGPVRPDRVDILAVNILDRLMIDQSDGVNAWNSSVKRASTEGMQAALTGVITKDVMNRALEQTAQVVPQLRRGSRATIS